MAVQLKSRPEAFHFPALLGALPSVVPAGEKSYDVIRLGHEHEQDIVEHLREFFFRDEPLNIATGISEEEDFTPLEEYILGGLSTGFAVGAVTPDGTLVGVCINAGVSREEDEEGRRDWEAHADDLPDDTAANLVGVEAKFGQIKRVLDRAAAESNLFDAHPEEDRFLDLSILSVHHKWRGAGIAKRLVECTRDVAKSEGYRLLRVICTSHFSAMASARLGFECVYRLEYSEMRDRHGKQSICPADPHRAVAVYMLSV